MHSNIRKKNSNMNAMDSQTTEPNPYFTEQTVKHQCDSKAMITSNQRIKINNSKIITTTTDSKREFPNDLQKPNIKADQQ